MEKKIFTIRNHSPLVLRKNRADKYCKLRIHLYIPLYYLLFAQNKAMYECSVLCTLVIIITLKFLLCN